MNDRPDVRHLEVFRIGIEWLEFNEIQQIQNGKYQEGSIGYKAGY